MGTERLYTVFHSNDPMNTISPEFSTIDFLLDRETCFTRVATVQAPLTSVFELTNDHGGNVGWTECVEVLWHSEEKPLRSTSVGDVIVDEEAQRLWLVASDASLEEFTPPPLLPRH